MKVGDEDVMGYNSYVLEEKACVIVIKQFTDDDTSRIVKVCQEKILVHELLHCKYNFVSSPRSYESVHLDVCEHQYLEQMAKTLMMVKYGIGFEWFKNF